MTRPWPTRISLVFCDVDGTLVTSDKHITPAVTAAVAALKARGIAFTIASARPPFGLDHVVEALDIRLPVAAFNGGVIRRDGGAPMVERLLEPDHAREAIDLFARQGLEIWAFTPECWLSIDRHGPYVDKEAHTIRRRPERVDDLEVHLGRIGKIVGVSENFAHLARCEDEAQNLLGARMSVARSQDYYLDVTHHEATKALALRRVVDELGIEMRDVVAIGDGHNDIGMLKEAGFGIAMGNAAEPVQHSADYVTASNEMDGVALAIRRLLAQLEEVQDRT